MIIQDIIVPLGDTRLDFHLVNLERITLVKMSKDTFLGYVLLDPLKAGMVDTKLIVMAMGQRTNRTYRLEVPIVGMVHSQAGIFGFDVVRNANDDRLNYPVPSITFDVSKYMLQPIQSVDSVPRYKPLLLDSKLTIKNTFNVPIHLKGIINNNPEISYDMIYP